MEGGLNYIKKNKTAWNAKTDYHIASDFYDLDNFLKGSSSLNDIELSLLGDIKNKSILHLQCHFGQDTISLARLGAEVTGVDFSDNAISNARELAVKANVKADFICCDLYELPKHTGKKFELVFTSYGTIGWLPDLDKWAKIISASLEPCGKLVFVEFHPVVWMFDYNFEKVGYNYFNEAPIIEIEVGTYADPSAPLKNETVSWNHSLSEVLNSLIKNRMQIISFDEYDYSPYNCFYGMNEFEPKKFRVAHLGNKIPMVYAVTAVKSYPDNYRE